MLSTMLKKQLYKSLSSTKSCPSCHSNHSHLMLFHHLSHSLPTTPLLHESYLIKILPSTLIYVTS